MSPQLSPCLETGEAVPSPSPVSGRPLRAAGGRIPVRCRQRNRFIPVFMGCTAVLAILSLMYLDCLLYTSGRCHYRSVPQVHGGGPD